MAPRIALAATLAALAGPAPADFAADEFPPYERCALCHGLYGVSHSGKFPHLGGQKPAYLAMQISSFLAGSRSNDGGQMVAIVTELKPEEIPVAVAWFAGQDPPKPSGSGSERGAALFADLACAACHNDQRGDHLVPFLSSQHAQYLAKQMGDFRDGRRGNGSDIGSMHRISLDLPEADLDAIADFLAAEARP